MIGARDWCTRLAKKKKNLPRLSRATMHGVCIRLQAKRRIGPMGIHGNRRPEKEGVG